jgi:O-antigen biosynthesis protein
MYPLTDIICIVHNQLPVTKGFVKHLYDNTENFRITFLNNGSADGTREYLDKISEQNDNCFHFHSTKNLGIVRGRNFAAENLFASEFFKQNPSSYFMNIDNDQYPLSKIWLQQLHDLIAQKYDIVGIDAWQLSKPGSSRIISLGGQIMTDASYFPFYHCSKKTDTFTYVGCGGSLIKKEVYDNIGLFDDRYGMCYFEDPHFCFEAIKFGYKIGWKYNCPVKHLGHRTINTQKTYNKQKEFLQSWNEFKKYWGVYFPEMKETGQ